MEQLRVQHAPMSFSATNGSNNVPDYDNVDEVTQDVSALMSRMKTLTDFIHNQNDLASSLGVDEKSELMEEQTQLQKKLSELKNKKQQMANLVNELQAMNVQAENNFEDSNRSTEEAPMIRKSPIDITDNSFQQIETLEHNDDKNKNDDEEDDEDEDDEVIAVGSNIIQDKIAEINAMKDQLKRLQDMMHTVKLIEIKNGDFNPDDGVSDEANNVPTNEDPQRDEEEREMAERVRALHSMTNDLRQQAGNI